MMCPTLEELEGERWDEPDDASGLMKTVHRLRRKPVDDFTVEDLRVMIGQSAGLQHLLPRALDILEADCLAEGDFYPGDLACAVASTSESFLEGEPELRHRIISVARSALPHLERQDAEARAEARKLLDGAYEELPADLRERVARDLATSDLAKPLRAFLERWGAGEE